MKERSRKEKTTTSMSVNTIFALGSDIFLSNKMSKIVSSEEKKKQLTNKDGEGNVFSAWVNWRYKAVFLKRFKND